MQTSGFAGGHDLTIMCFVSDLLQTPLKTGLFLPTFTSEQRRLSSLSGPSATSLRLVFERQARLAATAGEDNLVLRSDPYKT